MDGSDAETCQQRMKAVRHKLDDDFGEITERVREFGVWRSYVKTYPWVCLGTAAILGYLIIPRKKKSWATGASLPTQGSQFNGLPAISNSQPHQNISEMAVKFLGAAMLQGVSTYIGRRVGEILESHHENTQEDGTS